MAKPLEVADILIEQKVALGEKVREAIRAWCQYYGEGTWYFVNKWDVRNPEDCEAELAISFTIKASSKEVTPADWAATIRAYDNIYNSHNMDIENQLTFLSKLEEGSFQTTALDVDDEDDDEIDLPYDVHEAYHQE